MLDSNIFFSIAGAGAVTPNGITTLLINDVSTFFVKAKASFVNGRRNPPSCTILDIWVFKLFAKALGNLENCVSVNNNLCVKLLPSSEPPKTFNERFKVTLLPFFISDFYLLSCALYNFTFKVLYRVVLY